MGLTVEHLQGRLARFEFKALFLADLGWDRPAAEAANSSPGFAGTVTAIASQGQGTVVEVTQGDRAELSPPLFFSALDRLADTYADPLVIWRPEGEEALGQRSLWCWLGGEPTAPYWHTRVVVAGEVSADWARQLLRLHRTCRADRDRLYTALNSLGMPHSSTLPSPALIESFQLSWQSLGQALGEISPAVERTHYATVILARLIALATLQQRGYLEGDEWYLHNQFGQSQQRSPNQFWAQVFQPLCQGLALPPEERPLPLQSQLGQIPFLPTGPFSPHPLDQRWGQVALPDAAFEPALTWLGDLLAAPQPVATHLPALLERAVNSHSGLAVTIPQPMLMALVDRTLNAALLDRAETLTQERYDSIEQLLMAVTPNQAEGLLAALGDLTLLDPACGSGRVLLGALHQAMELAQALGGIVALGQTTMPAWAQSDRQGGSTIPTALGIYRHLTSHCFYGLDLWPPAVELARLQFFLQGVELTTTAAELSRLPDLTLTLHQGNALIGLVQVDSERFDQIQPRSRRGKSTPGDSPVESQPDSQPLQGNLLQPLLADTYQSVLAERQVRLEHYRTQTQLLAETGSVPAYAQADFLRDRIEALNRTAQDKLTHLLWNESSQQLGIRVQSQTPGGQRQTRLLTVADVKAVEPFHWGFYFHQLWRDRGGFDLILSHFPGGAVGPTAAGFIDAYQDLFEHKAIAPSTFGSNYRQVLTIDPDLAQAWQDYRGQFSFPGQYLRRSGHYPHSQPPADKSQGRLYWSRLFLERSLQLLRPGGRCAVVLDPFWNQANSAPLRHWLQSQTAIASVLDISNHGGLWDNLPPRTSLSLLWLKHQGHTQACPYRAYSRASQALNLEVLGSLLQRLIYLAE